MTTEFIPGKWYSIETAPIDTLALFGNVNWEAQGKRQYMLGQLSVTGKADCLTEKGDFTAWSPIPPLGEVKPLGPIPKVRQFIFNRHLRKGDELITSGGNTFTFVTYGLRDTPREDFYAKNNKDGDIWGWRDCGWHNDTGRQDRLHIIEVWRKDKLVAKGQDYIKPEKRRY
jgi:hypothetical protein